MSLARCIPRLVAEGKLSAEHGARAEAIYGERLRHHQRTMGKAAAEAAASEEAVEALGRESALRRRRELLTQAVRRDRLADMAMFNGGKDGPVSPRAMEALLAPDDRAPFLSVEGLRQAIKGRAHGGMDEILANHRSTITGALRNPAKMDELGRAAFGEQVLSTSARELAGAWRDMAEMLRQRFNAAGGAIGKLENWGLPQSHKSDLVRAAGWEQWRRDVVEEFGLARERMIDDATGLPFTDEGLETALRDVFETIRTDGLAGMTPGAAGQGSFASRRSEHRFLHFKDYEAWSGYQAKYGAGTAFDAMMGHVEGMSREIAAMELLGPNPDATVRWLQDSAMKQAALFGDDKGRGIDAANAGAKRLGRLWDEYRGALARPESRSIALGFSAARSVQSAAKLGGAMLSATSDLGTQAVARKFNGLPAANMIGEYAQMLADGDNQRFAIRRGLIAEEWANHTAAQNRFLAEELTAEWARRLAEGTLRVSGLSAWTQAGRWAFGMEFLDTLQGEFGKQLHQLDPALRRTLERYGFDAGDWDAIRATPATLEHKGEFFFRPQDIADQRLGDRVLAMVSRETDFAVPVADLRTRAMMNSAAPKGTIHGEIIRSAFLFKSFGISIALSHGRRALEQPTLAGKAGYAVGLTAATMIGGAIALQLKAIAGGQDPRPMDTPEFAGAAVLQGGGFGIFGDFLGASENRFGGGFAGTLAGPMVQTAQNVAGLTIGNAMKVAKGEDTHVGREFTKLLRQEVPGSSLWYIRLAYQRALIDQLQSLVDPDYRDSWRAMERRAADHGQEFFWAPGELTPERAPDLTAAVGDDE